MQIDELIPLDMLRIVPGTHSVSTDQYDLLSSRVTGTGPLGGSRNCALVIDGLLAEEVRAAQHEAVYRTAPGQGVGGGLDAAHTKLAKPNAWTWDHTHPEGRRPFQLAKPSIGRGSWGLSLICA